MGKSSDAIPTHPQETSAAPITIPQSELTFGQKRTRVTFNPSQDPNVAWFKQHCADGIDHLQALGIANPDPEFKRLIALAMTAYEEASQWSVKAVTT